MCLETLRGSFHQTGIALVLAADAAAAVLPQRMEVAHSLEAVPLGTGLLEEEGRTAVAEGTAAAAAAEEEEGIVVALLAVAHQKVL